MSGEADLDDVKAEVDEILDQIGRCHGISPANPVDSLRALNQQAIEISQLRDRVERLEGALAQIADMQPAPVAGQIGFQARAIARQALSDEGTEDGDTP